MFRFKGVKTITIISKFIREVKIVYSLLQKLF